MSERTTLLQELSVAKSEIIGLKKTNEALKKDLMRMYVDRVCPKIMLPSDSYMSKALLMAANIINKHTLGVSTDSEIIEDLFNNLTEV